MSSECLRSIPRRVLQFALVVTACGYTTQPLRAQSFMDVSVRELVRGVRSRLLLAPADTDGGAGAAMAVADIGTATGVAGQTVSFDVTLHDGGNSIVAIQYDIGFDPLTPVAAAGSDPDCSVNPAINKNDTAFGFLPPGCTPGVDCTAIRAIVIGFSNLDPIPDGSVLTSCNVAISASAPLGTYPLPGSNCDASDAIPNDVPTSCDAGAVSVVLPGGSLDHYKCYKIKKDNVVFPPTANLADQFGVETVTIKKPFLWCNPVSKNGGGINNPTDHLLCFKIKGNKPTSFPHLSTTNQFGVSTLFAKKPFLLCVPGSKALLP